MSDAVRAWAKPATLAPVRRLTVKAGLSLPPLRGWRLLLNRLAQSFRLMVGVRDYQTYLRHMQQQHPHKTPMTSREFHRYCLDARFPSKPGVVGKCPC